MKYKNKIMVFNIFWIILGCNIYSHNNKYIHPKIVIEAYKLLKLQLNKPNGFADMDNHIGEVKEYKNHDWYSINTVAGGADHEDRSDIVFNHSGFRTSITHFWDADCPNGDMELEGPFGGWFESAYTKANRFLWDDFTKRFIINNNLKISLQSDTYLYQYYWKDNIFIDYSYDLNSKRTNFLVNYNWNCGNNFCKNIFFGNLGRVCHLLTDMGVPEHSKRSMHLYHQDTDFLIGCSSPFETWLGEYLHVWENHFYWDAEKVYKERGGFVNPFCSVNGDNNQFLFYTLAQLSDWFISCGEHTVDGDTDYDKNIGEIESLIKSYAPSDTKYSTHPKFPVTVYYKQWCLDDIEGQAFRELLLPYTIRAVAGMLYKLIIESKMQDRYATTNDKGSIYDQQRELNLYNQDISGDYYSFRAEGSPGLITVCSNLRPLSEPANFTIESRAKNVTFKASKEIVFLPGFTAKAGSEVRAYVNNNTGCDECLESDQNPKYDRSIQQ